MKKLKLFSLALMALFSMSMWADISYYTPTADEEVITLVDQSNATISTHAAIGNTSGTYTVQGSSKKCGDPENTSGTRNYAKSLTLKTGNSAKTLVLNIAGCDSITLYHDKNSKARGIEGTATSSTSAVTNLVGPTSTYYTGFALDPNSSYTLVLTAYQDDPGTGGDINVGAVKLHKGETCSPSNASIIDDAVGFVGDAIDLEFTSENTSERDTVVKLDDGTATKGTDYIFVAEGFKPLTAGEFEITISQAKDGTHCEVEESVILTISQKTPVTDFTIPASSSARKGQEVNLSITDLDAAATKIGWILAGDTVSKTADYVFTPNAAGSYEFTAYAANEFNTSGAKEKSCTITVNISDDATLSALSVAGKTLTPAFAPAEVDYAVGQLDVYELLNVTATAADAPYATVEIADNKTDAVTITVTAEDESIKIYTISYTREAATELVSISESTTWDWEEAGDGTDEQKATTFPTNTEEFNFADVLIEPANTFNAAALSGIAQFAKRGGDYKCFQGTKIKFNTTVPGSITVYYQNTSNRNEDGRRWVDINGTKTGDGAIDQKAWYTVEADVNAGDVIITFEDKSAASTMLRINKIVFTEAPKYDITCNDAEHGSVSAQAQAHEDDVVTLTITPESGYKLNSLIVKDAEDADVEVANNKFTMPASNVTVTATFVEDSGTGINNTEDEVKAVKYFKDGQIFIEKNGHVYNVFGACVK